MISGVTRQLINAGVNFDYLPHEWIPAILAGTLKWLTENQAGLEEILKRLNFRFLKAGSEKEYSLIDPTETYITTLKPEDILFVQGALAAGKPIPLERLSISEKERNQCEDCGIVSHCLKDIRDPKTDSLKSLCNCCLIFHENPRVKDYGDAQKCQSCTVFACAHHPIKQEIGAHH